MKKIVSVLIAIAMVFGFATLAMAATDSFRASVTTKEIPAITPQDIGGTDYAAALGNEGSKTGVNEGAELIITPYSKINNDDEAVDDASFKKAYREIVRANKIQTICPGVDSTADYVVRDFFDITLTGATKTAFEGGQPLTMTFAVNGKNPYVLTRCSDASGWKVAGKATGDVSSITVTFTSLCPVAIIVEAETGEVSPATGELSTVVFGIIAGTFAVAAAGVFVIAKKKVAAK